MIKKGNRFFISNKMQVPIKSHETSRDHMTNIQKVAEKQSIFRIDSELIRQENQEYGYWINASKFQALHYQPTDTSKPNKGYFGPGGIEIPELTA